MASQPPQGIRLGGAGSRALAWLLDGVPLVLVAAGAGWALTRVDRPDAQLVVLLVLGLAAIGWLLVGWWLLAVHGATPGLRIMGLAAVRLLDGRPLGWGRALLRQLVLALAGGTGLIVVLAIMLITHPVRRGWHDLASGAVVVAVREPRERAEPPEELAPLDPDASIPVEPAAADGPVEPAAAGGPVVVVPGLPPAVGEQPTARPRRPSVQAGEADQRRRWGRPADELAPSAASEQPSQPEWIVDLGGGRLRPLRRTMLIGRAPEAALGEDVDLVGLGEASTVSKTHLAIGLDDQGPWVLDRGSTNGSAVEGPDGEFIACPPGVVMRSGGGRVRIGRNHVEIRRAG